ncbi:cation:proton antiporter [Burkholderia plantarii]|uniref:cation:proton antiporter n=1 Tax=Burkholderia plantarii TaxID=41899 RepID=UPI0006D88F6F|nr:cation:proton antiporter [Burkholderia plantarii]ALK30733.1 sodium/hydrogen exchanger [Burkholderia plantarii]GLZ19351.1 antiporter Na+ or K+/H+ exchanger [Burkholderia plantarii]
MWLIQVALVVLVCNGCGVIAERMGQCRVIGEIAGGILLGPLALGFVTPSLYHELFAPGTTSAISQFGEIGLALLMFEIGLDVRLPSQRALLGPVLIAVPGMLLPFGGGLAVGWFAHDAIAPQQPFWPFVLFCGVALSVSAVPVMARIVTDLNLTRHPAAASALSAAMVGDLLGWCALSLIIGFSRHDAGWRALGINLALLAAYVGLLVVAARGVLLRAVERSLAQGWSRYTVVALACAVLVSGWITSRLGFHSAFGALLIGMLLRRVPGVREQFDRLLGGFLHTILMPIFFACAGLSLQFFDFTAHSQWLWLMAFIVAGFAGKYLGVLLAARATGHARADSTLIATLMNARGLMELIFLSIGLQLRILPQNVYTMLVIFALFTTGVTAPLLRRRMRPVAAGATGSA